MAERTHTRMLTAASFYSRSPVTTQTKLTLAFPPTVSCQVLEGIRAPLTFPPLNPLRSRGHLFVERARGPHTSPLGGPAWGLLCVLRRVGVGGHREEQPPVLGPEQAPRDLHCHLAVLTAPGGGCSSSQILEGPGSQRKAAERDVVRMSAGDPEEGSRRTWGGGGETGSFPKPAQSGTEPSSISLGMRCPQWHQEVSFLLGKLSGGAGREWQKILLGHHLPDP